MSDEVVQGWGREDREIFYRRGGKLEVVCRNYNIDTFGLVFIVFL